MKSRAVSRREFLGAAGAAGALAIAPRSMHAAARMAELAPTDASPSSAISNVRVVASAKPILFDPDQALGSSMDMLPRADVDKVCTEAMVRQCLSAGWGPITYRQNTELSIAAWHWNPKGAWSDAVNKRGYFVGSAELGEPIRDSFGYPLPHRGTTRNGGAEHSYSRLTDGDAKSYWKSNPYLASKFTGQPDGAHPQWVVIDLGARERVSHVRIDWAEPYARAYEVQYWVQKKGREKIPGNTEEQSFEETPMDRPLAGEWVRFPKGENKNGAGGSVTLELTPAPIDARFVRIWMRESSNTADLRPNATHDPKDARSGVGYAIHEVYVGTVTAAGEFVDLVQHRADQNQTATFCSSIDPWHSAGDLDDHGDQTGFDLFFTSGITNHLPAMIPIAMIYSTPEDAAAQMAYLKKRGYAISYIEMGEEPDGQYMMPEDYAELYLQFATAMHRVDANLKLGGPVFQGVDEDIKVWPDAQGRTSWLGRFLDYLRERNRLGELTFVSFEHYPFAPCEIVWSDLFREPELISHILDVWRSDGVPANIPLMNTESNVTYENAQEMADIFAALWLADSVGAFLTAGGAAYYHSPIQPEPLRPGCRGYGTYGNYVADENLHVKTFTSQYYASQMINLEWVRHRAGVHKLYRAACDLRDDAGHALITAYAVTRPEGEWSILLINKDQMNGHAVRVAFDDGSGEKSFAGEIEIASFGSEQYMWKSEGANSHPEPNDPPVRRSLPTGTVRLPKASVTVVRGKVGGLKVV
jgi:hypothetical protein